MHSTFEEQEFGLGAGFDTDTDSDASDDGIPLRTSHAASQPASKPKALSQPKAS